MISVEDIRFSYAQAVVVDTLSMDVGRGDFVGILGPNGAGKSTLLKLIAGILPLQEGRVTIAGQPLNRFSRRQLAREVGFVTQDFQSTFNFSAHELVVMGRYPHLEGLAVERAEDRRQVRRAMEITDSWRFRDRPIMSLSGGERQRVILASALAQEPRLLLLDEPTNALDIHHQIHFLQILKALQHDHRMTIVAVTHDINLAIRYADRLVVLRDGRIVAEGAPETIITADLISSVYDVDVEIITHPRDGKPLVTF